MIDISNLSENELLQLKKQIETKLDSLSDKSVDDLNDRDLLISSVEQFNHICRIRSIDMRMDLLFDKDRAMLRLVEAGDDLFLKVYFADSNNLKDMQAIVSRNIEYTNLYEMLEDLTNFEIVHFDKDRIVIDFDYKNVNFSIVDEANELSISSRINLGHGTSDHVFVLGDFTLDVLNAEDANLEFEINRRTTIYSINQIELVLDRLCEDMFEKISSLGYYQK